MAATNSVGATRARSVCVRANRIPPHAGLFKTSRFVGLFAIINSYSATIKADMHCSHPIFKTTGYLFER